MTDLALNISIEAVTIIKDKMAFSDARFSTDGLSVVTRCQAGYARWNAQTGERLEAPHDDDPDVVSFAGGAGEEMGCHALDERVTAAVGNHFNGWADLVTTSPNGRYVAFGSDAGYLGIFDLELDMPLVLHGHTTSMNNHMHQNSINTMLFDASSTYLISVAEEDCDPLLWDLTAQSREKSWNNRPGRLFDQPLRIKDFTPSPFATIAFSPIESKFVTTHFSIETAQVWEIIRAK